MTLIYQLDLKIQMMHLYMKMNVLGQGFQKLQHCRQTDSSQFTVEISGKGSKIKVRSRALSL